MGLIDDFGEVDQHPDRVLDVKQNPHFLYRDEILSVDERLKLQHFLEDVLEVYGAQRIHRPMGMRKQHSLSVDNYEITITHYRSVSFTIIDYSIDFKHDTSLVGTGSPAQDCLDQTIAAYDAAYAAYHGSALGLSTVGFSSVFNGRRKYSSGLLRGGSRLWREDHSRFDGILRTIARKV